MSAAVVLREVVGLGILYILLHMQGRDLETPAEVCIIASTYVVRVWYLTPESDEMTGCNYADSSVRVAMS